MGPVARNAAGETIAASGSVPEGTAALELPLERDGTSYGSVAFGAKESGLPFTSDEREVLELATGSLAASLDLGARQAAQAQELERLSRERAAVSTTGRRLHGALTAAIEGAAREGLHVYALRPLRAE